MVARNTRNAGRPLDKMIAIQRSRLTVKLRMKVERREREVAREEGRRGVSESGGERNTRRDHDTRRQRLTPRLLKSTKLLLPTSLQTVIQEMRRVGGGREEGRRGGERDIAPVTTEDNTDPELHGNGHSLGRDITPLRRRPVKMKRPRGGRRGRGGGRKLKGHTRPQRGSHCLHGNTTAPPPPMNEVGRRHDKQERKRK